MAEIDAEQRHELELMIRELETENANLQEEYKHLQSSSNSVMTTGNQQQQGNGMPAVPPMTSEAEILHEAKMLREHKDRLESRMKLLEVHNNQLEMQLGKLRQLLNAPSTATDAPSGNDNAATSIYL